MYMKRHLYKNSFLQISLFCFLFTLFLPDVLVGNRLIWHIESENEVSGYLVYLGTESSSYSDSIDVGYTDEYLVPDLHPGITYYFSLKAYDDWGNQSGFSPQISFTVEDTSETKIQSHDTDLPHSFHLAQNVPNPFNPQTTIAFSVDEMAHVNVSIYNSRGEKIRTLMDAAVLDNRRRYSLIWDGRDDSGVSVSSGIYFYRLQAGSRCITKRMTLIK